MPPAIGILPTKRPTSAQHPYVTLGHDIWYSLRDNNPRWVVMHGKEYERFLDVLYIPAPTHSLDHAQICTINSFRTSHFSDPQFFYNRQVRSLFRDVIKPERRRILEIGPSEIPLCLDGEGQGVLCDIDPMAVQALRDRGYDAIGPTDLLELESSSIDLVVASFVFHFDIPDKQIRHICRLLSEDGLLVFNVLTKCAETRTRAAAAFSNMGFVFRIGDLKAKFGKDDAMFVATRASNLNIGALVYDRLQKLIVT